MGVIGQKGSSVLKIDYKIWYYKSAIDAGTEAKHSQQPCVLAEEN
jgi:hypothetical protein